jgi:hypothetical protein
MAVTATWTDNEDGTGAVVAITSTGGATNRVYTQLNDPPTGGNPWVLSGTRTGTGNVSLALAKGHYWWYVESNAAGTIEVTAPAYAAVTDADDAVHKRILDAVALRIRGIGLDGVLDASVITQWVPDAADFVPTRDAAAVKAMPGVICSMFGTEAMNPLAGTNARDEIGFPVTITMLDRQNKDLTANLERNTGWRYKIAAAFRNQRLAGVREIDYCIIEPSIIVVPESWAEGYWHSSLVVRCFGRFPRGI